MKKRAKQRWLRTGVNNLVRHHDSGVYYARFKVGGKQVWRSLGTTLKAVAKSKLSELLENERSVRESRTAQHRDKMSIADAIEIRRQQVANLG